MRGGSPVLCAGRRPRESRSGTRHALLREHRKPRPCPRGVSVRFCSGLAARVGLQEFRAHRAEWRELPEGARSQAWRGGDCLSRCAAQAHSHPPRQRRAPDHDGWSGRRVDRDWNRGAQSVRAAGRRRDDRAERPATNTWCRQDLSLTGFTEIRRFDPVTRQNLCLTVTLMQRWFRLSEKPSCARQDIRTYGRLLAGGERDAGRVSRSCRKDAGSSLLMVRHRLASASHVSPPNTPLPAPKSGEFFCPRFTLTRDSVAPSAKRVRACFVSWVLPVSASASCCSRQRTQLSVWLSSSAIRAIRPSPSST